MMVKRDPNEDIKSAAARWVASDAATTTFRGDWANVMFDIAQFRMLLGPAKSSRNLFKSAKLRKAQDELLSTAKLPKNKYLAMLQPKAEALAKKGKGIVGSLTEGVEEGVNHISMREGSRRGDILMGLRDENDSNLAERIKGYTGEDEFATSFMWGALGGAVFQGIGAIKNRKARNEAMSNKLAEVKERANLFNNLAGAITKAKKEGNTTLAKDLESKAVYDMAIRAIEAGNVDLLIEQLQDDKINEVLQQEFGVTNVQLNNKKNSIIEQIKYIENAYNKRVNQLYNNRFADLNDVESNILAAKITGLDYSVKTYSD
ncbi:hypothetical protein, partial [Neptunomonas phycophila]|uniref:hypothetical protein n=1 Tax=Neptunomonas phycophila TaxID=1572645 RepID=UPI0023F83D33